MQKRCRFGLNTFLLLLISVSLSGCSSDDEWKAKRPKLYRAQGVVNLDGKPLDDATVVYHSQSHGVASQAVTDKEGRFTLSTYDTNDGAPDGKHKVVVTKRIYEIRKTKYDSPTESSVAKIPKEVLPIKYALPETTPLEIEVSSKGSNNATIDVMSK